MTVLPFYGTTDTEKMPAGKLNQRTLMCIIFKLLMSC